jgi:hypothetical protein
MLTAAECPMFRRRDWISPSFTNRRPLVTPLTLTRPHPRLQLYRAPQPRRRLFRAL